MEKMFRKLNSIREYTKKSHPALKLFIQTFAIVISVVTICAGVAMLVLPGPGLLFILLGLGILSIVSESLGGFLEKLTLKMTRLAKYYKLRVIRWHKTKRNKRNLENTSDNQAPICKKASVPVASRKSTV